MHSDLVSQISKELINFQLPDISVIIAGNNPHNVEKDVTTPHIYVIEDGILSCRDKVGFACIGIGASHANSTFMLSGYTPSAPAPKALLIVYSAKKRAEVSPGVGTETDNFMITSALGSISEVKAEIMHGLAKIYANSVKQADKLQRKAEEDIDAHIQKVVHPATTPGQKTTDTPQ